MALTLYPLGLWATAMTVKSARGRRRYTAFEVPPATLRGDLERAVAGVGSAKVITCKDGRAVIRSLPSDREALAEAVGTALPGSRSYDCSGTLRALRSRNPELTAPRRRHKRRNRPCACCQILYTAPFIKSR